VANYDKVIPPGQEGKVHLVIEGSKVHGTFQKSATIHSNDPKHPVMSIAIAGNIKKYVEVLPANRVYLQGRYGEEVERVLTIKSNEGIDFKVTGVESNIDDKITYRLEDGTDPGSYLLRVWKNPKLPTLNTFGTLTVHTNSEKAPESSIQVQVTTRGEITVQPQQVNFGQVQFGSSGSNGKPVERNVTLLKTTGEFEISDITFNSDQFEAEIEPMIPGRRYQIRVKFTPPKQTRPRESVVSEMLVHTNDPHEPTVRVKLRARSM
jgi:hypothetical protein